MRTLALLAAGFTICTLSLAKPLLAAEPAKPSAFALHGSVGWVFVEDWDRDQAPAWDQLHPQLALNAYLGSRYLQPSYGGLSLGGQLLWDYRTSKGETARLGYVGVIWEF